MPTTLESFTKWIAARKEEHLHALPGSPGFEERLKDLHRYAQAEFVINEYIDHLYRSSDFLPRFNDQISEVTPGDTVPFLETSDLEQPCLGMYEQSDFLGGQDVSR